MTPEFDRAQERVEAFTAKWQDLMSLDWLKINHRFNPGFNEDSHFIAAETDADWEYRQATIYWFLPRVCALADVQLEEVVVHELVHVLNAPSESVIATKDAKLCEFATESVARAILAVRNNGQPVC